MIQRKIPYLVLLITLLSCQEKEAPSFSTTTGTSSAVREKQESWELELGSGVDILFFGDTSGSMTEELQTLGEELTVFIDELVQYTDDWQIIAVTGPDGCGIGGVLDPSNPNYSEQFATGIITPPGEDLVDEWGLYNVQMALEESKSGGCNEGFLRENARLHVIFISDEEDNSPGWDTNPTYWNEYYDAIASHKTNFEQLMFSGVIGPLPDGCYGVEAGNGYADLIHKTEGEYLSICDNWQNEINRLVDASVSYPLFALEQIPIESSIQVRVDDEVQNTWNYEEDRNAVYFGENPPKLGNDVRIVYDYYLE
ncbi:MAG: hypothetical protein VX278_02580 [Myxococcota bacterium]|nr:hypothetical protein [Myxococcota bacterium]